MADNLIFPVKFDLEAAVRKAQGDADKYLRQLQTTIHSKPLAIDLKIVNAGSGSLNEISKRMRDIVTEWNNMSEAERVASKTSGEYTDRAKKLIAEFARLTGASETYARSLQQIVAASRQAAKEQEKAMEKQRKTQAILLANEKSIASITAKLKYWKDVMNSSDMGGKRFRKAAEEVRRLNQSLGEAQRNVNSLTGQFKKQDGYVSRLVKRLVVYAGFQQINNFLTSVRSVTAEFELQRISLGAIIQDQTKANALFSEIKNFALKSPIKILDLTKYTKQLAAYKIGVNELFDTTKRLADISVGIGVSMDRLILLYGQVRATGYLRASEIRQATEAGIPLVEELANKLSEANGTLVTSAQVLKMVEERAISFEMVKEVFEDMTNAGGLFYDMQEKQGNTLYGMWQKLGDAAAMMYDEIGNTPWVNEGMKEAINMLRTLMIEWKRAGANIATLGVAMLLYANKTKLATLATKLNTAANTEGSTVLRGRILHLKKAIMYQNLFATSTTTATTATKLFTLAQLRLTQALNLVVVGFKKLSAAFMSNIWGIALVGLSLLIEHLIFAKDQAKELKNELANINLDYESKQGQDAANLEYLANAAVNAAKGSKAQKDALEELKNTYGKIIPMELLTIENLERMKGNYGELIALIDEYNLKQKYEKETSAIESSFAPKEEERANKIRNILSEGLKLDYADEATGGVFDKVLELTDRNIQRFLLNLKKYAEEGKDKTQQIVLASQDLGKELGLNKGETEALTKAMIDLDRHELEGQGTLMDYTEALYRKNEAQAASREEYEKERKALNEYSAVVDEVLKKNEEEPEVTANKDEFENEKARLNNQISDVASGIVELLNKANVAVDNGTQQILNTVIQNGGMIPDAVWDILEKAAEAANNPKLLAAIQDLRKHYKGLAPDDETVNFVKNGFIKIVSAAQGRMKEYRQYLYDGKTTIKEYQDFLQKSISGLRDQVFQMVKVNALIDAGLVNGQKYDEATIKAAQEKADALQAVLDKYVSPLVRPDDKNSKSRGTKSDPRLQILNEMVQLAEKLNKEYSDWEKKVGSTKALEKVNETYAETVKYAEQVAKDAGISLPHLKTPTNAKELNEYLEAVRKVMESAKGLKGGKKAAIELAVKMSNNVSAEDQKAIEEKIKALADRISRTKTAKEFYEKILSTTGNVDMAINLTTSIFGENGEDLNEQIALQIYELINSGEGGIEVGLDVVGDNYNINYKNLRKLTEEAYKAKKIGDQAYKDLIAIADNGEKDVSKMVDGWLKATEKAKSYSDKLLDLARTTNAEIAKIEAQRTAGNITDDYAKVQIQGYKDKQAQEIAKLQYEAFKDSPMYVQMFDDLDNASTTMLRNMKQRIEELKTSWKDLTPTQLKEMQSRLNEIDAQLAKRNPFKGLIDGIKEYRNLRKGGDALGNKSEGAAEKTLDAAAKARLEAEKEYLEILNKEGATQEEIAAAKKRFDDAAADEDAAAKAVENWKKVKDAIGLSANELFQMLNWAGDIAKGIADISEAMGADEEDVQYWNDVADALGEISGGIQDIVQSAMSGNVVGIISSTLTAIPKMFVGFANLFSAGKIKRANKEIKRQQRILEELEYAYGRFEKAMERVFGPEMVGNIKAQQKNLQAQAEAYRKQAEAERSKGKKTDEDKLRDYENSYRETMDRLAELQGKVAEQLIGSDLSSTARDFAKAWVEAYREFGNTADAMGKKFREMVENMVTEGLMARAMERALKPAFDMIDGMEEGDFYDRGFWERVMETAAKGARDANAAGATIMAWAEQWGYQSRGDAEEARGIAKSVGSATSEEVNANTAALTTQTHYMAMVNENVWAIRRLMEAGTTGAGVTGTIDYTPMMETANAHLSSLPRIEHHIAEIHTLLGRVVTTRGGSWAVNSRYTT